MDRRDFLIKAGSTAGLLFIPQMLQASKSDVSDDNPLLYSIKSTQDFCSVFNEKNAAKARKVAEYVITKNDLQGIIQFDPNHCFEEDCQGVQTTLEFKDWKYVVWVANYDENAFYTSSECKKSDLMSIWMRPKGTTGQNKLITLTDRGLDGRCNFGVIPPGLSETGQKIVYSAMNKEGEKEGLKHRPHFQELYLKTLDTLLQFYEQKK